MATGSYQGLARKFRPQAFAEMVGQEAVAQALMNALQDNRVTHGHIMAGPRGVGKTTSARILARALNCVHGPTATPCGECRHCTAIAAGNDLDVIEFDAASNTKVEQMRELLERVMLAPFAARYKVYIIDEVHMLSAGAFNALLKTLEEPPPQVIFIFATTELEKIPETIRSRCTLHTFRRLSTEDIVRRLAEVSRAEGLDADSAGAREVFALVAQMAEGGMRDALVALDQILAITGGALDPVAAQRILGLSSHATLAKTIGALASGDAPGLLGVVEELVDRGLSLERFVKALLACMHDIMLMQSGAPGDMISLTGDALAKMREFAQSIPRVTLFNMIHQLFDLEEKMKRSTQTRFLVEFTFLRMSVVKPVVPIDQLISRLQALPDAASSAASTSPPPRQAAPLARSVPEVRESAPAPAFEPEPSRKPPSPSVRPAVPARQLAFHDSSAEKGAAPAKAGQPAGPNPLLGLDRDELINLIGGQLPDTQQFLCKYLASAKGFRIEPNRFWIQWDPNDRSGPRYLGKPENKNALEATLALLCGCPMSVEGEAASASTAPSAPPSPVQRPAAAFNDAWGEPEEAGFGMDNPFLAADPQATAPVRNSGVPAGDLPEVDPAKVKEILAGGGELARRAKMVRDFFDGTYIDTAGSPLAI